MLNKKAYKLTFYVPIENAQEVKKAIFAEGAGKIGNYDCCSWETVGCGQFRPLKGSNPAIGTMQELTTLREIKVDIICPQDKIERIIKKLKEVHPYEEVSLQFWEVFLDV